jgi:hypothetical protein
MTKPRFRVRAHSWTPPTAAGLARWRRLLGEALSIQAHWDHTGAGLASAASAIFKDAYPTRDKAQWPIMSGWVAACKAFAAARPAERAKLAGEFRDLNAAAEAIMFSGRSPESLTAGLVSGAMSAAIARPVMREIAPPPAAQPNARRDIFE